MQAISLTLGADTWHNQHNTALKAHANSHEAFKGKRKNSVIWVYIKVTLKLHI